MQKDKLQLTSVKVHRHLFDEFKVECVRTKFSLQKLADRALYLYLTDEEFKETSTQSNNIKFRQIVL